MPCPYFGSDLPLKPKLELEVERIKKSLRHLTSWADLYSTWSLVLLSESTQAVHRGQRYGARHPGVNFTVRADCMDLSSIKKYILKKVGKNVVTVRVRVTAAGDDDD